MENQSKVIVIERNKFAALVKSHRKCLQMLNRSYGKPGCDTKRVMYTEFYYGCGH